MPCLEVCCFDLKKYLGHTSVISMQNIYKQAKSVQIFTQCFLTFLKPLKSPNILFFVVLVPNPTLKYIAETNFFGN